MPPTSKRGASKAAAPPSSSPPLANALLLAGAVSYGLWILVARGRVSWPPHELLSGAYTLAGCLALVGPVILARRDQGDGGLGDLAWMTGGGLGWGYDLLAPVPGGPRAPSLGAPPGGPGVGAADLGVFVGGG